MADSIYKQTLLNLVTVVSQVTKANGYAFDLDVRRDKMGEQNPEPYRTFIYTAPRTSFRHDSVLSNGAPENQKLYQRMLRFVIETSVPGSAPDPATADTADTVDDIMLDIAAAIEKEINSNPTLNPVVYTTGDPNIGKTSSVAVTWVGEIANDIKQPPPTIYLEVLCALTYIPTDTI